ncbi:MAG: PilZ domain-containing protein [Planctomycetota bacterium]
MTKEHRRHKRYYIKGLRSRLCASRFFGLLIRPTSEEYICLDISESGLQFITKKLLTQNKLLLDVITPLTRKDPIRVRGRVAWVKLSGEFGIYFIGVRFVSLGKIQRDRLKMLIANIGEDKDRIPKEVQVKIITELLS